MPNIPLRNGGPKARIAVIPGDGIGREVTPVAVQVIRAATAKRNRPLEFVEFDWGADKYLRENVSLPEGAVEMLRDEFDAILFGALGDPRVPSNQHAADILLGLRFKLDLYVNARPTELLHDAPHPAPRPHPATTSTSWSSARTPRASTSASAASSRRALADEIAVQEDVNSRKGVERIIRYAFDYARAKRPQARLHVRQVQRPDLRPRPLAARLQIRPRRVPRDRLPPPLHRHPGHGARPRSRQFDVIVTCNLFGDIISDLAAQLAGGLGLAPSANIHPGRTSLFEPVHGSAPNIAGKGIANPFGSVLASGMMLEFLGWHEESAVLKHSVKSALHENITTPDLGGSKPTLEVSNYLTNYVSKHS